MRYVHTSLARALLAATLGFAVTAAATGQEPAAAPNPQGLIRGHSTSVTPDAAILAFALPNAESLTIALQDGRVLLNESELSAYRPRGPFEQQWRDLLERADTMETPDVVQAIRELDAAGFDASERLAARSMALALSGLALAEAVISGLDLPDIEAGVPTPEPGPAELPAAPAPTPTRILETRPSLLSGVVSGLTNLAAVLIALAFIGLGLMFFAPHQLEIVSDTVWHSFGRSFLTGLLAQPLIVPLFGMMIVGLTLTVVGVVLLPVAIVAFVAALVLAVVGGYIAVARTVGELYLRRRMARGEPMSAWAGYRYIVYGLLGVMGIWLPAVLFGWIPVAGTILMLAAAVMTWTLATAGFGAAILSRGGIRGTFVRRLDLALTDEQYWTADGLPAPQPIRRRRGRS